MTILKKFIIYGCESRGDGHLPYMTRYTVFACKWFSIKVHVFHRDDHDVMHDHPWWFWSLILWGGYTEDTPTRTVVYRPGRLLWRPSKWIHRIRLHNGTAVTLVVSGPRHREWSFWTKQGPVWWKKYFSDLGC